MPVETIDTEGLGQNNNRDTIALILVTPSATNYTIPDIGFDFDIYGVSYKLNTGTCEVAVEIDGTAVTWTADGATLDVDNTSQTDTPSAGESLAAGENLEFVVSNLAGSPAKLEVVLHILRT